MNETLRNVWDRMAPVLNRYSTAQKRNMVIGALFLLIAFIITLWVFMRPHYVVIMSGLDDKSIGQVQTQLQTLKIPNEIQGSSVLVPASQADTARVQLAMAGLPKSGYIGYQSVTSGNTFGVTSDVFNIQVLDALQQNLNQTISSMDGIDSAQVYIVEPQNQLFVSQPTSGAKASVYVTLGNGVQLSNAQVYGIQTLVSHSVQGLVPSNVAVTNQYGVTLSSDSSSTGDLTTGTVDEIALRQKLESSVQQNLVNGLNQIVGPGNAVVAVHANVTFNETTSSSKTYGNSVLSGQQKTSSSSVNNGTAAGGLQGQSSSNPNLPTYTSNSTANGSSNQSSSVTSNYDVSLTNTNTISDPMQLSGFTVSVILNSTNTGKGMASEIAQIKQFVADAVGQTPGATNNSITVSALPFQNQLALAATPRSTLSVPMWAYAVGALVLLGGGGLAVMRRRRQPEPLSAVDTNMVPFPIPEEDLELMMPSEDDQMRDQLVKLANQKPGEFANLLRTWLLSE